jgi:hypothetical protein
MTGTKTKTTTTKRGGNFSKDLANLSVPFGLILAQKSLEKYLNMKSPSAPKKEKKESAKKPLTKKSASTSSKKETSAKKAMKPRKTVA